MNYFKKIYYVVGLAKRNFFSLFAFRSNMVGNLKTLPPPNLPLSGSDLLGPEAGQEVEFVNLEYFVNAGPVMLYGSECWANKQEETCQINEYVRDGCVATAQH